jgi:hypothetical protein
MKLVHEKDKRQVPLRKVQLSVFHKVAPDAASEGHPQNQLLRVRVVQGAV